jgi:hypothetical protein
MMRTLLLIFFLLQLLFSQNMLSGYIKDYNGKALLQISVYLDNTTLGTTTDPNGFYEIKNIPSGFYNLIATSPGFKTFSMNIELNSDKTVSLKLEDQIYESETIVVVEKRPLEWISMLRKFKREFLGENDFSEKCNLLNPEVMNFSRITSNQFSGYSEQDLQINNNALGYKLYMNVLSFQSRPNNINYATNIRFEELEPFSKEVKETWEANRRMAFKFSSRDLFKFIYHEKESDDFQFFLIDYLPRDGNYPKEKIDYKDILATDKYGQKYLYSDKYLVVEAKTHITDDYKQHSRNTIFSKDIRATSIIEFKDNVYLNKNGIVDTKAIKYYGYFAFLRISSSLPLDYLENEH